MSKQRTSNFSNSEKETIIKLVLQKMQIFENKKTDAVTSKQKDVAWEQLAYQFNALSGNKSRTAKILKEKYNNIKRSIRKEKANIRKELFLTGGGPPPKGDKENSNPVYDELSDVMGVSVDGLPSRFDDDVIFPKTKDSEPTNTIHDERIIEYLYKPNFEEISTEPAVEISINRYSPVENANDVTMQLDEEGTTRANDWSKYQPTMLRTKRSDLLKNLKTRKRGKPAVTEIAVLKKKTNIGAAIGACSSGA